MAGKVDEQSCAIDAMSNDDFSLAVRQFNAGAFDEAAALFRRLAKIHPGQFAVWLYWGVTSARLGDDRAAIKRLKKAISIQPSSPEAHNNLGLSLRTLGRFKNAAASFKRAIAINPDYAEAFHGLGSAYMALGELDEATASYRRAVKAKPDFAEAHYGLGVALNALGKLDAAVESYRRSIAIRPDFAEAYSNLGGALSKLEKLDEAVACCQRAAAIRPDHPAFHSNLGSALQKTGNLDEAIASFEKALAIQPDIAEVLTNLGFAFQAQGKLDEAMANYRRALAINPDLADAQSHLLFCLNYAPTLSAAELSAEARNWAKRQETGANAVRRRNRNQRAAGGRLRIGYVSPDFRQHSVAHFLEPVLRTHDRARFEVYCYAQVREPDSVTEHMRNLADQWCSTVDMDDGALTARIATDQIDVLVDLAGHTSGNRLPVFAQRPAPAQITWLGYCGTTGLSTIDYRFSDDIADPAGESDILHSEQLFRLPHGFLCYAPPADVPEIAPPPVLETGYVTFGSFNNLSKMTPEVTALWSRILKEVPASCLLLKSEWFAEQPTMDLVASRFAAQGIDRSRLQLLARIEDTNSHLGAYGRMDIALDPFPYNGTTTTCEALWMGRPVVALRGDRHAARVSASILTHCGLEHLIAETEAAYVEQAVALARDLQALQAMAGGMRARMAETLCNAPLITGDIEAAYHKIWQAQCEREAASAR